MIAAVTGRLEWMGPDSVIIGVAGVSLRIAVPASLLNELGEIGAIVKLYTHLYVREDQLALYGFMDQDGLSLFEMLLGVAGVGPRAALNVLSNAGSEAVQLAIAQGDVDFLKKVPGIGVKTASRIILELKGKLVDSGGSGRAARLLNEPAGQKNAALALARMQVIEALTGLGYTTGEVQTALSSFPPDHQMTLEEQVLAALRFLGQ